MELSHNSQYMDNKLSIQTDYIYQVIAFKSKQESLFPDTR